MRLFLLLGLLVLPFMSAAGAAELDDALLQDGLKAALPNGIEAAVRVWYADRPALVAELRERLQPVTRTLGTVIDTEIVAVQAVSKRVTRYYIAIYYTHCPVWLRIDRYANGEKTSFLPLRFSISPDDILPAYVTEVYARP